MTADRDITQFVRSWLKADEHESADRVLDVVLGRLDTTPQRRPAWPSRRLTQVHRARIVLAAAAVVAVAVGVVGLNLVPKLGLVGPGGSAPATTPRPTPTGGAQIDPRYWSYLPGRHNLSIDGIRFSLDIPAAGGWEPRGPRGSTMPPLDGNARISINRSYMGPQSAEAMIYWTSPDAGADMDSCDTTLGAAADGTIADLVAAVGAAPGLDLLRGPEDVVVGGRPAKHLVVTVREDMGCDPGYFFTWDEFPGGALWTGTKDGDTIRVWIVDVEGLRLFIAAETHTDAPRSAEPHVQEIVDSIQFE